MSGIVPQPGILNIALYEGGQSSIAGRNDVVKLSSNENPFGTSPQAVEAVRRAVLTLHRYPSTNHHSLRIAIGELHALDPDQIICGVGSDEIINWLCQAYAGPGDEVLFTEHGFAMYRISALAHGATPVEAPEQDRVTDVDALLAACSERTRLVFIANPNNPTGTMIETAEIARLAQALPQQAILVLDGAYAEYVEGYDGGVSVIEEHPNVFMTRTFSKLYGLGGMRVGWGYGSPEIIGVLNRIRGPFNLSKPALDAAEAALRDREFVERSLSENNRMRGWLAEALAERGVMSDPSYANFILARFQDTDEAEACDAWLKNDGIIVRRVAGYKLPHCLRITIGDEASCRRVAHAIGAFMDSQG